MQSSIETGALFSMVLEAFIVESATCAEPNYFKSVNNRKSKTYTLKRKKVLAVILRVSGTNFTLCV